MSHMCAIDFKGGTEKAFPFLMLGWLLVIYMFDFISRWWFQIFFYVHPYLGKIPILTNIFQLGWFNHQLSFSRWEIESIGAAQFGAYPPHNLSQLRYPLGTLEDEFWACHRCRYGLNMGWLYSHIFVYIYISIYLQQYMYVCRVPGSASILL